MADWEPILSQAPPEATPEAKVEEPVNYVDWGSAVSKGINTNFAANLDLLAQDFQTVTGRPLRVTSGFRTRAEQANIYNSGVRPAARPGHSRHERGEAVDIDERDLAELNKFNLSDYGFETLARINDPGHLQWSGNYTPVEKERLAEKVAAGEPEWEPLTKDEGGWETIGGGEPEKPQITWDPRTWFGHEGGPLRERVMQMAEQEAKGEPQFTPFGAAAVTGLDASKRLEAEKYGFWQSMSWTSDLLGKAVDSIAKGADFIAPVVGGMAGVEVPREERPSKAVEGFAERAWAEKHPEAKSLIGLKLPPKGSMKEMAKPISDFFRDQAVKMYPKGEAPKDFEGKVMAGLGALPMTLAVYGIASEGLGAAAGMALVDMINASDEEPGKIITEGVKGFLMGKMLKGAEPLAFPSRMATTAGMFGFVDYINGGDAESIATAASLGAALALMGGKGELKAREAIRDVFTDFKAKYGNTPEAERNAFWQKFWPTKEEARARKEEVIHDLKQQFAGIELSPESRAAEAAKQEVALKTEMEGRREGAFRKAGAEELAKDVEPLRGVPPISKWSPLGELRSPEQARLVERISNEVTGEAETKMYSGGPDTTKLIEEARAKLSERLGLKPEQLKYIGKMEGFRENPGLYQFNIDDPTRPDNGSTKSWPVKMYGGGPDTAEWLKKMVPIWRSRMTEFISSKLPGGGTGEGLANTIQSWVKSGKFKSSEFKWSGIEPWLREQKGKVTKQQVLDKLREENQVQVNVKQMGGEPPPGIAEAMESIGFEMTDIDENIVPNAIRQKYPQVATFEYDWPGDQARFWDNATNKLVRVKISDYVGSDLVNKRLGLYDEYVRLENSFESTAPHFEYYMKLPDGGKNYREFYFTVPQEQTYNVPSGHTTGDPAADINRFAHMFVDDRMFDGKKYFTIWELQGDWESQGRHEGWIEDRITELPEDFTIKSKQAEGAFPPSINYWVEDADGNQVGSSAFSPEQARENALLKLNKGKGGIPHFPFEDNWQEVALKWALRYAAENGYDGVAWASGDIVKKRWSLAQAVSEISAKEAGEGRWRLKAKSPEGDTISEHRWSRVTSNIPGATTEGDSILVDRKDLGRIIGDERAEKLVGMEPRAEDPELIKELDKYRAELEEELKGYNKIRDDYYDIDEEYSTKTYDLYERLRDAGVGEPGRTIDGVLQEDAGMASRAIGLVKEEVPDFDIWGLRKIANKWLDAYNRYADADYRLSKIRDNLRRVKRSLEDTDAGWRTMSGEDLEIGGEWANQQYDKKMPGFMSRYGKQWGAKVGEHSLKEAGAPKYEVWENGNYVPEQPEFGNRFFVVDSEGNVVHSLVDPQEAEQFVRDSEEAYKLVNGKTKLTGAEISVDDAYPQLEESFPKESDEYRLIRNAEWEMQNSDTDFMNGFNYMLAEHGVDYIRGQIQPIKNVLNTIEELTGGRVETKMPDKSGEFLHTVKATPEMKKSVITEGQYLYSGGPDTSNWFKDIWGQIKESRMARGSTIDFDMLERAGAKVWSTLRGMPEPWTDYKETINKMLGDIQISGQQTAKFIQNMMQNVPDKKDREAIINWIQAGGDPELLQARADATKDAGLKEGYLRAMNLDDRSLAAAKEAVGIYDMWLKEAQEAGAIEGFVENYVTQIWGESHPESKRIRAEVNAGLLNTNFAYARRRLWQSYFQGEQAGKTAKNKDIAYVMGSYYDAMHKAVAARAAMKGLLDGKTADGSPILSPIGGGTPIPGRMPEENRAFEDVPPSYDMNERPGHEIGKDKDGNPITAPGPSAYLIKPKKLTEDQMTNYRHIDHPALRKWKWIGNDWDGNPMLMQGELWVHKDHYNHLKNVLGRSAIRQHPVGEAVMKGMASLKGTLLSMSPFHIVQIGVHGLMHTVNIADLPEIDLSKPAQQEGVRHGLMIYNHGGMQEFAEGVYSTGLPNRIPGIGPYVEKLGRYTFEDYIPRLKMKLYLECSERNLRRYENRWDRDQILSLSANQANAAFGELNYKSMGRNPTLQDVFRLLALAPDFLEARLRFVGQAFRPGGKEQAYALLRGAAGLAVIGMIGSSIFGDKKHGPLGGWSWKDPFSLHIGDKTYNIRSVPGDLNHLFKNPRNFAFWRLNPSTIRPLIEMAYGRDVWGRKRDFASQVGDYFVSHVPIPLQPLAPGISKRETTLLDGILRSIGVGGYKYRTAAGQAMLDYFQEYRIDRPANSELIALSKSRTKFMDLARSGKDDEAMEVLQKVAREQKLEPKKALNWLMESQYPEDVANFRRLPLEVMAKIMNFAEPHEEEAFLPILADKIGRASPEKLELAMRDLEEYLDKLDRRRKGGEVITPSKEGGTALEEEEEDVREQARFSIMNK